MDIDPVGSFAALNTDDEEMAVKMAVPMKHLDTSQIPLDYLRESLPDWLVQAQLNYANVQRGIYRNPEALAESSYSATKRLAALAGMLVEIRIHDEAPRGIAQFEAMLEGFPPSANEDAN